MLALSGLNRELGIFVYPCVMEGQCEPGRIFRSSSGEVNGPFWGPSRFILLPWPNQEFPPEVMTGQDSCEKVSFVFSLIKRE